MKTAKQLIICATSTFMALGLTACNKQPAQTAGESIDRAMDKTGETIGDASDELGEQKDKVVAAIDDTAITTKVKAAIFAEPDLKSLQIHVDTSKGVTLLTGEVDSAKTREHAAVITAAVNGVTRVDNQLQVAGASKN